jgi:hypothetical protein
MDARNLFADRQRTYLYLERYVNNGSPSGFSETKTTSEVTSPYHGDDQFPLLEFTDEDLETIKLGVAQPLFERGVNYAHPDSANSSLLSGASRRVVQTRFRASPTAGGRTMLIRTPPYDGYIKLTYDISRIGRVDRQLTLKLCQSSLEVTQSLKKCVDEKKLLPSFSLLLESSSKVTRLPTANGIYEWGVIYRESKPYPYQNTRVQLVPGFALFGKDRGSENDEFLINQFIRLSNSDPQAYLRQLLMTIVDCYWGVVVNCAFHPETHAQNCLFEVSEDYQITRLVMIDMQSVDKDIPLARYLGLNEKWDSYPEACFDRQIYFYNIRSSFIYDFKLGEYLLTPIVNAVVTRYNVDTVALEKEVREHVQARYICKLPSDYFPADGCWYDCDKTERKPGQRRQYYPHKNPKYR